MFVVVIDQTLNSMYDSSEIVYIVYEKKTNIYECEKKLIMKLVSEIKNLEILNEKSLPYSNKAFLPVVPQISK